MQYRFVEKQDITVLAALRLEYFSETTERAIPDVILPNTVRYLEEELATGTLVGIVAVEDERIVAVGLLSLFSIMPTIKNPTGKRGHLFDFYTRPEYRRQGIAMEILTQLMAEARNRGVCDLFLNAREMAISIYENAGFRFLKHEMRARL